MARRTTHPQVEYAVDDAGGNERVFKKFDEAAAFAVGVAMTRGSAKLDVLVMDESGAKFLYGDDGVDQYNEDPDASVFERYEIKVNAVGRVP